MSERSELIIRLSAPAHGTGARPGPWTARYRTDGSEAVA
jgi:hypothetical protein